MSTTDGESEQSVGDERELFVLRGALWSSVKTCVDAVTARGGDPGDALRETLAAAMQQCEGFAVSLQEAACDAAALRALILGSCDPDEGEGTAWATLIAESGIDGLLPQLHRVMKRHANPALSLPITANRKTMTAAFFGLQEPEVLPHPKAPEVALRLMTYNVHFFVHPWGGERLEEVVACIAAADADVVVLQEMRRVEEASAALAALGYAHSAMGSGGFNLTNAIFSKMPLAQSEVIDLPLDPIMAEQRCAVFSSVQLAAKGGHTVAVPLYGTHLDVHDESGETREEQVKAIQEHAASSGIGKHMVVGDFNSVRKRDYDSRLWAVMQEQNARRGLGDVSTRVEQAMAAGGYEEVFDRLRVDPPTATVWSLRRVDFAFLSKEWRASGSGLVPAACFPVHVPHSDHIPLCVDFVLLP